MRIPPDRLGTLLSSGRIALVGASDKSSLSSAAYDNLREFGLGGRVHLVNRRSPTAHDKATHPS